jgi:hypothetical protein
MKENKFYVLGMFALVLAFAFVGCVTYRGGGEELKELPTPIQKNAPEEGNGRLEELKELPANLKNTQWEGNGRLKGRILEFKADQIFLSQEGGRTFKVISAVENGKIIAEDAKSGVANFCSSYSISETVLTLNGDRSFNGSYDKKN